MEREVKCSNFQSRKNLRSKIFPLRNRNSKFQCPLKEKKYFKQDIPQQFISEKQVMATAVKRKKSCRGQGTRIKKRRSETKAQSILDRNSSLFDDDSVNDEKKNCKSERIVKENIINGNGQYSQNDADREEQFPSEIKTILNNCIKQVIDKQSQITELHDKNQHLKSAKTKTDDRNHHLESEKTETDDRNHHLESEKTETDDRNYHLESEKTETDDRNQHRESEKTEIQERKQHLESEETETHGRNQQLESEDTNSHTDENNCNVLKKLKIVDKMQCSIGNGTNTLQALQTGTGSKIKCVSSSKPVNAEVNSIENILQKQGYLNKIVKKHLNKKGQDMCVNKSSYFEAENVPNEIKVSNVPKAVKELEELIPVETHSENTFEQKEIQDPDKSIENTNSKSSIDINGDLKLESDEKVKTEIFYKEESMQDDTYNFKNNQAKTRETDKTIELKQSKNLEHNECTCEQGLREDTSVSETHETKTNTPIISKMDHENKTNNFDSNNFITNFEQDNRTYNIVNANAIDTEENKSHNEKINVVSSKNEVALDERSFNERSMDNHNDSYTQILSHTNTLIRNDVLSSNHSKTIGGERNNPKENKILNNSGKIQDEKSSAFSSFKNLKMLTIPCMSALEYVKECEVLKYNEYLNTHSNYYPDGNNLKIMHGIDKYDSKQSESGKLMQKCEIKTNEEKDLNDRSEMMDCSTKENALKVEDIKNIEPYISSGNKSDSINKNEFVTENVILVEEVKKETELDIIPISALKQLNELFGDDEIMTVDDEHIKALSLDEKSNEHNNLDFRRLTNDSKRVIQREKIDPNKILATESSDEENENKNMNADLKSKSLSIKGTANLEVGNRLPLMSFKEFAELHNEENLQKENEENSSYEREYKLTEYEKVNISKLIDAKSEADLFMEMDDDFSLTASQLSMLEADEQIQSSCSNITKQRNIGQQTENLNNSEFKEILLQILKEIAYMRGEINSIKDLLKNSATNSANNDTN